jgi:hypothetical protein
MNVQNYHEDDMDRIFLVEKWGPNFWFFLMTLALSYPDHINPVVRRKYYDFIMNLPLFIPNYTIGNDFSKMLDKYPVSPYLDNRDSFVRWVVFIHNKVNQILGKPILSREQAIRKYFANMVPQEMYIKERKKIHKYIVYGCCFIGSIGIAYFLTTLAK